MTATIERPRRSDRDGRHQLVFELTGLALLLAATRNPELVLVPGAILLPATRRTWLRWVHDGLGTWSTLVAALLAATFAGLGGAGAIGCVSAAIGAMRARRRGHHRAEGAESAAPGRLPERRS